MIFPGWKISDESQYILIVEENELKVLKIVSLKVFKNKSK